MNKKQRLVGDVIDQTREGTDKVGLRVEMYSHTVGGLNVNLT